MSAAARLEVKDVYAAYDKADVLEGVTLSVAPGSITCLLGSNGSGKTTLIRAILGLTPPRAGSIRFGDAELTGLPTHKVVAAGIACIPEGRKVFPKLTVEENLRLGAYQESSAATVARTRTGANDRRSGKETRSRAGSTPFATATPSAAARALQRYTAFSIWAGFGSPFGRVGGESRRGAPISPRPIDTIACSPPDRVPASCARRSARRGKIS